MARFPTLGSGDRIRDKHLPDRLTKNALDSSYVPLWTPSTVVTAGTVRTNPSGIAVSRIADGTTRATYDVTEAALWTKVVLDKTSADGLYAPVSLASAVAGKLSTADAYSVLPIAVRGDSTTAATTVSNPALRWPNMLAAALGQTVENLGSSGATSAAIFAIQGGRGFTATVAGNQIPASGPVTLTNLSADPLMGGEIVSLLVSINGIVGALTKSGANRVFTRSTAGSALNVLSVVDVKSVDGESRYGRVQIIGSGSNDIPLIEAGTLTVDEVCADFAKGVSVLTPIHPRFLVWGPLDRGQSEGASTARGIAVRAIETYLAKTFGANFVNVRKYLVDRGLVDAGIAATSQDTADIAAGAIPQSLRDATSVHLNAAGMRVQFRLFERIIRERGWVPSAPPVDIVNPTIATVTPANGATASGAVSITGTSSDNLGVAAVSILKDGVLLGTANLTGSTWSFVWDSTSTANGAVSITARATDVVGNATTTPALTLTVNNVAQQLDDPVLSVGSLLLVDPAHPVTAWPAGVPANNASVPNIAASKATAILGGTPDVSPKWILGSLQAPGNSIFERSVKGGLHGIVSQSTAAGAMGNNAAEMGRGAYLSIPQSILDYIIANPTHSFFSSIWTNITRLSGDTNAGSSPVIDGIGGADPSSTYLYYRKSLLARPNGANMLGRREAASTADVLGPAIRNVAISAKSGTAAVSQGVVAEWGKVALNSGGSWVLMPSFIFHRFYLEDLTVSGRTYATVDGLDNTAYNAQVLTSGGRYYQDAAVTAPSTLA